VFLVYASGNRDERVHEEPERFLIRRDGEAQHLGFGRGIHFCLGAPLARLEARIVLERLLTRLPNLRLADPGMAPEWKPSLVIRGLRSLPVAWDA
jgi:cytochrome P450